MAGIALSTAGVTLGYAVETVAEQRPTTGYKTISDIKEIPDFNPEPEALESTTLEEKEYKTYVKGLKDIGGPQPFRANFTQKLQDEWEALITAYETAKKDGKRVWFEIQHPDLKKSVFFHGEPSEMGMPGMGVNAVLETTVYITPNNAPVWETKTTAAAGQ